MDVCLLWVFVLSGSCLCVGPISRPEESYRLWCVPECDQVKTKKKQPRHLLWVGRRGEDYEPKMESKNTVVCRISVLRERANSNLKYLITHWEISTGIFCGATAKLGPRQPHYWISYTSHKHTPSMTTWTSDRIVAKAATCTTHDKHIGRTSMLSVGFDPAIPSIMRPKTYALDRMTTGIGLQT
jgi:hypothetical protein